MSAWLPSPCCLRPMQNAGCMLGFSLTYHEDGKSMCVHYFLKNLRRKWSFVRKMGVPNIKQQKPSEHRLEPVSAGLVSPVLL